MGLARLTKLSAVASIGAALAFLFDPDRGRARRARLRDQTRAKLRREARAVERKANLQRGRVAGLVHRATQRGPSLPQNDRVLADKVRSEVLGRRPLVAHQISIDVVNGVVTLRGEVDDTEATEELAAAVRRVVGVTDVVTLVHRPGEPAPNKAPARGSGSGTEVPGPPAGA